MAPALWCQATPAACSRDRRVGDQDGAYKSGIMRPGGGAERRHLRIPRTLTSRKHVAIPPRTAIVRFIRHGVGVLTVRRRHRLVLRFDCLAFGSPTHGPEFGLPAL